MRVLHYTLGFQPHRTGGLVKYANDLMNQQFLDGHEVIALYPGEISLFCRQVKIKKAKNRKFQCYKIINSLPLALFGGIIEPKAFMTRCNKNLYRDFLKKINIDIIHIHSFMGLHKEFLEVANDLDIRIVFTSHDYYGLAPIPNFFFDGVDYSNDNTNLSWNIMSSNALSVKKLRLFQFPFYSKIRRIMKICRINPKIKRKFNIFGVVKNNSYNQHNNYGQLFKYYKTMFDLVDGYLFNSNLAKEVYNQNGIMPKNHVVVSLSNNAVKFQPKHHIRVNKKKKKVAYIGPDEEYKGYFDFLSFAKKLDLELYEIVTYGHLQNEYCPSFIEQKGYFRKDSIDEVYSNIDILIVPSKWKETFGLITVEALSYGVNVFVSSNVGAKDLIDEDHIFIDINDLLKKIKSTFTANVKLKIMDEHSAEIMNYYKGIINNK